MKRCPFMPTHYGAIRPCMGSNCALWDPMPTADASKPMGRCGLGKGANFPDPAQEAKS